MRGFTEHCWCSFMIQQNTEDEVEHGACRAFCSFSAKVDRAALQYPHGPGPKTFWGKPAWSFWRKSLKICQVGCDFILTQSGCNLIAIYKTKWSTNKQQAKAAVENTWQKTKEEMLHWVLVPDFGQPLPSNDLVII